MPLESTITDYRNAVIEKMDLSLRLATQVKVGRVMNLPTCKVTDVVEGENRGF